MKMGLVAALALLAAPAIAQPVRTPEEMAKAFTMTGIAAPAEPGAIPLYPGVAPGSEGSTAAERWTMMGNGKRTVRNVVHPTITPFLPDPAKATGAAVIVAPGGGFQMLAMDDEGWPVAKWLAAHGIAAFVLKYRVNETPADEGAFMARMGAVFASAASGGERKPPEEPRATADALAALKMVRGGAAKWRIDPARVGMIGFSAGAMTALNAARAPLAADRPAFFGYIYGPMVAIPVAADAPAMFAALALDDGLFGRQGFGIVESWKKAGRPVEFHAYERGDHGFGMGFPGTTTTGMMTQFRAWLEARGLLKK
jgi:acetyl esterase/lipase